MIDRLGKFLGVQTNNFAEYMGLLLGLRRARQLGVREVEVFADSELMMRRAMKLAHEFNLRYVLSGARQAYAMPADFGTIIRHIEEGRIDTRPWITHRPAFEELIDVFPSYVRPETGVIKAIVDVGD